MKNISLLISGVIIALLSSLFIFNSIFISGPSHGSLRILLTTELDKEDSQLVNRKKCDETAYRSIDSNCSSIKIYSKKEKYCGFLNKYFSLESNCLEIYISNYFSEDRVEKLVKILEDPCAYAKGNEKFRKHPIYSTKLGCSRGKKFRQFDVYLIVVNLKELDLANASYDQLKSHIKSEIFIEGSNKWL